MTVLTLGCGIGIQVVARRIDTHRSARASGVAMALIVVGMGLAALAAATLSLVAGLVAAAVLGVGYGLALVAGLSEVTRIAEPRQLAGLTAVYYSIAYLGFFVPMTLAWLARTWTYAQMFGIGMLLAAACLGIVVAAWRAHLPVVAAESEGAVASRG
jgi:MFS family permease